MNLKYHIANESRTQDTHGKSIAMHDGSITLLENTLTDLEIAISKITIVMAVLRYIHAQCNKLLYYMVI